MFALEQKLQDENDNWPLNGVVFRSEQSTLTLDVYDPNLAKDLVGATELADLQEHGFRLTEEPHITVINYVNGRNILRKIDYFSETGQAIILRNIETIANRQDWSWRPTGELHSFVGRNYNILKIIAMVDCPGVEGFYRQIEELVPGGEIERHPMHITLLKGAIGENELPKIGAEKAGFNRPLNGLGHLALGYEYEGDSNSKVKAKELPTQGHVKEALLRIFRIDPGYAQELPYQELRLLEGLEQVSLPLPRKTQRKILRDFEKIDILAAAALGRRISLVPEALENLLPGAGKPMTTELLPLERATFFDEEMESALKALKSPQITAQKVITGAIVHAARLFNNQRLQEEVKKRLAEDPIFYPVRNKSMGALRELSDALLRKVEPKEEPEKTLQTEVIPVKLRAA
ncbi:hypothetical protein HY380_00785 [Candidatus Saccharibacteria bacterium]|nr:hypothetical protein [Candidatus Saccharibacteria bacterium]